MEQYPVGLYEEVVTKALDDVLSRLDAEGVVAERRPIDDGEAATVLAQHLAGALFAALRKVRPSGSESRLEVQASLANEVLQVVARRLDPTGDDSRFSEVSETREQLLALARAAGPLEAGAPIERPAIPLTQSDLLVNARDEHRIGAELRRELRSADSVDLICAFLKWTGYRILSEPLEQFLQSGRTLRVITSAYMGATDPKVLDHLDQLGALVRVSCDIRRTRLHAKAWLFHRASGYDTAFIGSSNMSKTALLDGLEWNVRLSGRETPNVLEKFKATFDSYWEDREFEDYARPGGRDAFVKALDEERGGTIVSPMDVLPSVDLRPYGYQEEILERLAVERTRGHTRNLVVAATGTGKTIIAAFDFRRLREAWRAEHDGTGREPRMLFVAHRQEILEQSQATFRLVLRDRAFGELFVGGRRPREGRHVFASIQSLSRADLDELDPAAFDVVVVDEFHHAEAPTYRRVLSHLQPRVLLGLTATPERTDGKNVKDEWFDGRYAAELRLWDALEKGLLCPFQYFGVSDGTDLAQAAMAPRPIRLARA